MKGKSKGMRRGIARVAKSSGKVFADLGLPDYQQELLKAQLTLHIYTILKSSKMKQSEMTKILGVRQSQVSLSMRNRGGNFSVGRLMEFLTALQQDVQITVRPARKQHGSISVNGYNHPFAMQKLPLNAGLSRGK
jgi:predicted XRE-type DNA-binding protein